MIYLILAVAASSTLSVVMRLSKGSGSSLGVICANYVSCVALCLLHTIISEGLNLWGGASVLILGLIQGLGYLMGLIFMQFSINKNGVVLSSVFAKLGLLVSLGVSVFVFGENPTMVQLLGCLIAVFAIVLINWQKGVRLKINVSLILLLLVNGLTSSMSKIFQALGYGDAASQFLLYTFMFAFVLCFSLMKIKGERIEKKQWGYGAVMGFANYYSSRLVLEALEYIPAVVVFPTYAVGAIVLISLCGVIFFHEKLSNQQWTGFFMILAAIALLNL